MKYPFAPLPTPDDYGFDERLDAATNHLRGILDGVTVYAETGDGLASSVSVMTVPGHSPYIQYRQDRDGSIHVLKNGVEVPDARILCPRGEETEELEQWANSIMMNAVAGDMGSKGMARIMCDPNSKNVLIDRVTANASRIINKPDNREPRGQAACPVVKHRPDSLHNSWSGRWCSLGDAWDELENFVQFYMLDLRAWRLGRALMSGSAVGTDLKFLSGLYPKEYHLDFKTSHYNFFQANRETVLQLIQSGHRNIISLYLEVVEPPPHERPLAHPGQVVAAVKDYLDLTPAQWRYFLAISPNHYMNMQDPAHEILERCAIISDLNLPDIDDELANIIFSYGHHRFLDAQCVNMEPRKAWVETIRAMLQSHHLENGYSINNSHQFRSELGFVEDALWNAVQRDEPWNAAPWDAMVRRSERWHVQQRMVSSNFDKSSVWDPALDEDDLARIALTSFRHRDRIKIEELSSAHHVAFVGEKMHNCLTSRIKPCMDGNCRVFVFRKKGRILAAAEVVRDGNLWVTGQIEGQSRADVPPEFHKAHLKIAEAYRQHAG